jgi:hypothetical protein
MNMLTMLPPICIQKLRIRGFLAAVMMLIALVPLSTLHAEDPEGVTLNELEKKFMTHMSGSVLTGNFTLDGQQAKAAPRAERYEIKDVKKISDGMWLFQTRMKYGKVDSTMPIPVPIVWAGDTPMVSMTNLTIPGMGTFSCRVIFDGDRYAGTWQHGEKGGHMWGMIEKDKPTDPAATKEATETKKEEPKQDK